LNWQNNHEKKIKEYVGLILVFVVYCLNISRIKAFVFLLVCLHFFIYPRFIPAVSVFFRSFVTGLKPK